MSKFQKWRDWFAFRLMITPYVAQIAFVLGSVLMIYLGAVGLYLGPAKARAGGLLMIIVGPFVVRLVLESAVVLFRINESLLAIKNKLGSGKSE